MKLFHKMAAIVICAAILTDSSCASPKYEQETPSLSDSKATLKICLKGNISDAGWMLETLNQKMEDNHLNIELQVTQLPDYNYANDIALKLNAHEDFDIVFDATWLSFIDMAGKGAYLDLGSYFNNDRYPALKKGFSDEYLKANLFNDKNYGIPIDDSYLETCGIFYRKDLLKKCALGFDSIDSAQELRTFYEAILKKYPDMVPLSLDDKGFFLMNADESSLNAQNVYDIPGWPVWDYPAKIVLDSSEKNVRGVLFAGDDIKRFRALGFREDFVSAQLLKNAEWSKYIQPDSILSTNSQEMCYLGQSASFIDSIGNGSFDVQRLTAQNVPGVEVGFWPYEQAFQQGNSDKSQMSSLMQASNFLCIPSYSKNADAAMTFINWLLSDRSRLELLAYGVEGKDWEETGSDSFRFLSNSDDVYSFPSCELLRVPSFTRVSQDLSESEKRLITYASQRKNYRPVSIEGWSLNVSRIPIEITQLNALYREYYPAFSHGQYGTQTAQKIDEFHAKSLPLGLETVRASIIQQLQYYLDCKYKNG